jgi:putative holliday junction resolvase
VSGRTRILAVDPGKARLGLAISDPERRIASPFATWNCRDREQDDRYLRKVIEDEEVGLLIVGLPIHLDGREGVQAQAARKFGAWLGQLTGLPCVFWDERFTTREAEGHLWDAGLSHKRRKERRDQVAAQILLRTYLDAGCPAETTAAPFDESQDTASEPPA